MGIQHRHVVGGLVLAVCAGLFGGCRPANDSERAFAEAREAEAQQREALRATLEGGTEESAAIKLVRQSAAPEGGGNTEAWIQRRLGQDKSSVMFPHWQASRRGIGKYEVRFTYTAMDELGEIKKRGLAWTVDLVLKLVSPPRELKTDELGSRSSPYYPRRQADVRHEELKLE